MRHALPVQEQVWFHGQVLLPSLYFYHGQEYLPVPQEPIL